MKVLALTVVVTPWVFVFGGFCQRCIDGVMSLIFFRLSSCEKDAIGGVVKSNQTATDALER
jgi:hypothetical protein